MEAVVPGPGGSVYLIGMIRPRTTNDLVRIARTLPDGKVDEAFRYAGDWVYSAWVASPDGGVFVVTQSLKSSLATTVMEVLRLQPNGTPDPAFKVEVSGRNNVISSGVYNPPYIFSMARQVDGRLLLAGKFDRVNGVARRNVARLEPDGSLDGSFDPGAGPALSSDSSSFGYPVQGMTLGPDGGIYVAGQLDRYNGRVYRMVVRLRGDPVPRLRVGWSAGAVEASWIGHPGARVEVESSPDLSQWNLYHSFTNDEAVVRLPRPTGETVFLRARWR